MLTAEAEGTKVLDIGNANPRNEEALGRSRNKYHSAAHPREGVSVVEGGCGGTEYDCDRRIGHRNPLELPCTGNSGCGVLVYSSSRTTDRSADSPSPAAATATAPAVDSSATTVTSIAC